MDAVESLSVAVCVNSRGHRCPTPTLRLRRVLEAVKPGSMVLLLADDPMARIDVAHFIAGTDHVLVECAETKGVWRFSVQRQA